MRQEQIKPYKALWFVCFLLPFFSVTVAWPQDAEEPQGTLLPGWKSHERTKIVVDSRKPFDVNLLARPNSLQVECSVGQLDEEVVSKEGHLFRRLSISGLGVTGSLGRPELPVWRRLVEVPLDAKDVSLKIKGVELVDLAAKGEKQDIPIVPVQPPMEKIPGVPPPKLTWDHQYYKTTDKDTVPPVEISYYGIQRGRKLFLITVSPLEYIPAANRIAARKKISFEITWKVDKALPGQREDRYSSPVLDSILDTWLLNPPSRDKGGFSNYPAGLLIIAAPAFATNQSLANFVAWKTERGLHTTLVSTAETGSTNTAIFNYIQNAYRNWTVPPSFLLLVGDTDTIPHWTGGGFGMPPTDLNYTLVDGPEWNTPDIWHGRFSVRTVSALEKAIDKTIRYEKRLWVGSSGWEKQAAFMAGVDNYTITEGTHNYVISNFFNPAGFTSQKIYMVSFGGTTQHVRNAANEGRSFLVFSGHGSETSWADGPSFTQSDVYNLTNSVYPMVFGFACVTGNYVREECFGETWLRHSSGGLAYWGSSVNSYWDEDDILEKALFEGFWNQGYMWIGAALQYALQGVYNYYGGTSVVRRYFEMYNLMGDPSVDLLTNTVQDLAVSHSSGINAGAPSFPIVCSVNGAVATITQNGTIHGTAIVSGGNASIPLVPPIIAGEALLTVTAQNYKPYQATLNILSGSTGLVWLGEGTYPCEAVAQITVMDTDLNADPGLTDVVPVMAYSNSEPSGEQVLLVETDINTGIFTNSLSLSSTNALGVLQVSDGDTLRVLYIDADDGLGNSNVPVIAEATIDCSPPVIGSIQVENIRSSQATIRCTTDQPASITVRYGLNCGALTSSVALPGLNTNHIVVLSPLVHNTPYYFVIEAVDAVGNVSVNNNAGMCYTFTTQRQVSYFTEFFEAGDFDLRYQTLVFTPDGSTDFYSLCRKPASVFPSSPTGGTTHVLYDDSFALLNLSSGRRISLYGTSYSSCYIGSNGNITFGTSDNTWNPSFNVHFSVPRISALFLDLNPSVSGAIVSSRQFSDHVAITYRNVPEYGTSSLNNFQIRIYYDGTPQAGTITITYLGVDSTNGLVGLSRGTGVPQEFQESNLSAYPGCLGLGISPESNLISSGQVGGTFTPGSITYTVSNIETDAQIPWTAEPSQPWITVSPSSGTLPPAGSIEVTVSINASAGLLAAGSYEGFVTFTDAYNQAYATRGVTLTVLPAPIIVSVQGPIKVMREIGDNHVFYSSWSGIPGIPQFQWFFASENTRPYEPIEGTTNATLLLLHLQSEHSGWYRVGISWNKETVFSEPVHLVVVEELPLISNWALLVTAMGMLIVSFFIRGRRRGRRTEHVSVE